MVARRIILSDQLRNSHDFVLLTPTFVPTRATSKPPDPRATRTYITRANLQLLLKGPNLDGSGLEHAETSSPGYYSYLGGVKLVLAWSSLAQWRQSRRDPATWDREQGANHGRPIARMPAPIAAPIGSLV
jgi:hypothetical protein